MQELRNTLQKKTEQTEFEKLQKLVADQIAILHAQGGRQMTSEEVDRVVRAVDRKLAADRRSHDAPSSVNEELDQHPEIANLNTQLHKVD